MESTPVKWKIELDATVLGEGIILDEEIVVGETILIVAIEGGYSMKVVDFL